MSRFKFCYQHEPVLYNRIRSRVTELGEEWRVLYTSIPDLAAFFNSVT